MSLYLHNQLNLENFIEVKALLQSTESQAEEEILAADVSILFDSLLDWIRSVEFG